MRNPETGPPRPPVEQSEPFLPTRTPPTGTLRPPPLPPDLATPAHHAGAQAPAEALERHIEGLRVELLEVFRGREILDAGHHLAPQQDGAASPQGRLQFFTRTHDSGLLRYEAFG